MDKNIVVETLQKIIGNDQIDFISGEINGVGTKDCSLSDERGCVYGIAIKIDEESIAKDIFKKIPKRNKKISNVSEWQPIDGSKYYPLYWGKDINMGSRLHSHTKNSKTTHSIQLNTLSVLFDKEIIYGAVPCENRETHEKELHKSYKCLLKTVKTK